jgi:hypothetical protein
MSSTPLCSRSSRTCVEARASPTPRVLEFYEWTANSFFFGAAYSKEGGSYEPTHLLCVRLAPHPILQYLGAFPATPFPDTAHQPQSRLSLPPPTSQGPTRNHTFPISYYRYKQARPRSFP